MTGPAASRTPARAWATPTGGATLELGDFDGDDDLDAFVTNFVHGNSVWLNDGTGNFTAGAAYPGEGTEKMDLGDIEGDGDLDAFTTNHTLTNKIWLNDGLANFTAHRLPVRRPGHRDHSRRRGQRRRPGCRRRQAAGLRPDQRLFQHHAQRRGRSGGDVTPRFPFIALNGSNPTGRHRGLLRVPASGDRGAQAFDVRGREVRTLVRGALRRQLLDDA